jgi:hypothetical protein
VFSVVTRFTCMSVLHDIDTNKLSLVRIRSFLKPSIPRYVSYVMIVDRYLSISHTSQFTEIYDAGCCLVVMNLSQLRGRFFFFLHLVDFGRTDCKSLWRWCLWMEKRLEFSVILSFWGNGWWIGLYLLSLCRVTCHYLIAAYARLIEGMPSWRNFLVIALP